MKEMVIIGAGGHAKVVIDIFNGSGYEVVGVVDDNALLHGQTILDIPILGGLKKLEVVRNQGVENAFVAIGNNEARVSMSNHLKEMGFRLLTAIHPSAIIADSVTIGEGSMVAAGGIINPASRIGKFVIINTGATVDHDCIISDGVHISPGVNLAGNVHIGVNTHIGIGSCVIQGIHIAENSLVGAGSTVVKDIESNVIAYGNPARVKRIR